MKKEYFYVAITGILSGLIVFMGQVFMNLGLSLYQISFLPQLLIVIFLLPLIIFNKNLRPKSGMNWIWILYGLATALCVLSQYGALVLGVPIAIVVLLLYTQPLWTMIITKVFLKEKITKINVIASIIVLIGMVILVNPFNIPGIKSIPGTIIALIGGICISGWVTLGSFVSKKNSPPVTTKFLNAFLTCIFMIIAYPIMLLLIKDSSITHLSFIFSPLTWIYLIIFTLFVEILGHILYFKGTKVVPTMDAGIILLLEPVVGSLLAAILLSQALTINIIIGGILILVANYLVIKKSSI